MLGSFTSASAYEHDKACSVVLCNNGKAKPSILMCFEKKDVPAAATSPSKHPSHYCLSCQFRERQPKTLQPPMNGERKYITFSLSLTLTRVSEV